MTTALRDAPGLFHLNALNNNHFRRAPCPSSFAPTRSGSESTLSNTSLRESRAGKQAAPLYQHTTAPLSARRNQRADHFQLGRPPTNRRSGQAMAVGVKRAG